MTALLRLEDVTVRAGERTLLRVDEIEVRAGETLAIIGETGAGKTTLLRVMNALLRPERGRFLWQGRELRPPVGLEVRRRMAMAFQEPLLFAGTVFDNVAFGLRLRGERGEALAAKVTEALRLFGIERLAAQSVRTLSGGEAQRTALARAMVLRPALLLLDEPLASLDPPTRERLGEELRRVLRERGVTCAYVTHDQGEAQAIGDRVAVLDGGEVLQVGTPAEVFLRPATARVARFVGTRNLLEGERAGDGARVTVAGRRLETAACPADAAAVLVCVRPEEIVLRPAPDAVAGAGADAGAAAGADAGAGAGASAAADAGAAGAENRLPATVRELRPVGATTEVHLDCGFPLVALVTRRTAADLALREGAAVTACFRAAAAHVVPRPAAARR